jgi:hypothetical protein
VIFPDVRGNAFDRALVQDVFLTGPDAAADQATALSPIYHTFTTIWTDTLIDADAAAVLQVLLQGGGTGAMDFFEWDPTPEIALRIGTGDGATLLFSIPAKETTAQSFTVGGAATGGTIGVGDGPSGQDTVTFAAAPAVGVAVAATFRGRRMRRVVLSNSVVNFDDLEGATTRWHASAQFREVPA